MDWDERQGLIGCNAVDFPIFMGNFIDDMKYVFILFGLLACSYSKAQVMKWPHGAKAAIVLTYDDALPTQLDTAVPQLKKAKLKGTFFLTSDVDYVTMPRWRQLAKEGFELGNHTVFHPCPASPDNPVSSDGYTPYQIIREIEIMDRFLFALDGKTNRTYAYPCAVTTVGGKDYVDTLRRYKLVRYARIGGDMNAIITDYTHLDTLRIPALGLEDGTPADSLIDYVQRVQKVGGLGIFMFHGIGGDYITTPTASHQALVDYLRKNRKDIWVATFQEVMDYVMKNR